MKFWRRLIAVSVCVLLLVPLAAFPAQATVEDAAGYTVSTFWGNLKALSTLNLDDYEYRSLSEFWRQLMASEDPSSAYTSYVDGVETATGTGTVVNGGIRMFLPATEVNESGGTISTSSVGDAATAVFTGSSDGTYGYVWAVFGQVKAPFDCTYKMGAYIGGLNSRAYDLEDINQTGSALSGQWLPAEEVFFRPIDDSEIASFTVREYLDIYPYTGVSADYFEVNLSSDTRATAFSGPVGYYNENGEMVVDNSQTIINEGAMTLYNPATGQTSSFTDWAYDYESRGYTLTMDDGTIGKVTYGDENATVNLSDSDGNIITYNYYYMVDSSGGGSGGDTGGGDAGGGSVWDKLGGLVGGLLDGIIGIVNGVLSKVLDALIALVDMINGKLDTIVQAVLGLFDSIPQLFGGFLGLIKDLFVFLPAELVDLIEFGLVISLFTGLILMIFKR